MSKDKEIKYSHRYAEYLRAHGANKPEDLYSIWHTKKIREFASQWDGCKTFEDVFIFLKPGIKNNGFTFEKLQAMYDEWLTKSVDKDLSTS